jgi:hypothetical protein
MREGRLRGLRDMTLKVLLKREEKGRTSTV